MRQQVTRLVQRLAVHYTPLVGHVQRAAPIAWWRFTNPPAST